MTKSYRSYQPRSARVRDRRSRKKIIWSLVISIVLIYASIVWILPTLIGAFSVFNKPNNPNPQNATEDITLAPPVLNIPYEATNSATIDIPGYAAPDSEVQLYLNDALAQETTTQSDGSFVFRGVTLTLGVNHIFGKTLTENDKSSLPSKNIRLTYSNEKPKLIIDEPEDNKTIQGGDKKVKVVGQTDTTNVTVNNQIVIVGMDGRFSTTVDLNDGENVITINATNAVGNSNPIQRKVIYTP